MEKDDEPPKRRVCIISFFYRPAGGGIPRYIENISKKIAEMGHQVDIITASYDEEKIESEGNITIYRLPCMNIFGTGTGSEEKSREFLEFLRKYSENKPDIIAAQNTHAAVKFLGHTIAVNIVGMEKNIPVTLTTHAFIQEDEFKSTKIAMIKDLLWERIVSVGSNLAESLFNQGVPSDKMSVVLPPVDTDIFRPGLGKKWLRSRIGVSENEVIILHASRLDSVKVAEEKGVFNLVKALSLIKEKNVKVLISAAPTIPIFEKRKEETIEKIIETAKLFGVENKVVIKTFNPEDMARVYNGVDLFVMASEMESSGLVYAEALACEIPVIGTSVGGIPEIIENGKSGELIKPHDHVELAKQIKRLIKNPKKMEKFGKYGRKVIIERQGIDKITRNLLGVYESVISKKILLRSAN